MTTGALGLSILILLSSAAHAQESVEEKLRPSVVRIRNDQSSGTGMFLDGDGLILTNAHVACSPLPFSVQALVKVNGRPKEVTFSKVTLLGFHPEYDMALLRVNPSEFSAAIKPVQLAREAAFPRERVWAIGFPGDYDEGKIKVTTWGEMRSLNKDFYGMSYLEMDISVYHGNSGGPLCNNKGEVLGVITAISRDGGALAVPISAYRPEKFGPLKNRVPNREMSSTILKMAEEELKSAGGRPSEFAMMLLQTALLWDSGNAGLYAKVGGMNVLAGRAEAAVAYLTRSLQMQPWAERADTYHHLGLALAALRKSDEALAVWREGLDKYPLDNAPLWGELAAHLEKKRLYSEAALTARIAVKTRHARPAEMEAIHRRSHDALSRDDQQRLRTQENDIDNHLGRMRAASDQARRDHKTYLNPEAEKVIATMSGVQRESVSGLGRVDVGKPGPLKMSDEELDIRFIRGRIDVAKEHLRYGRQDKAVEILQDVIQSYPTHPETEAARLALKIIQR